MMDTIETALVPALIAVVFWATFVGLIRRYSKTKDKATLFVGISCFLWATTADLVALVVAATAVNSLPLATLLNRVSITLGISSYAVFVGAFGGSVTKPDKKIGKMPSTWITIVASLITISIVWAFDPIIDGFVGGTVRFTLTSMYKAPYGLPLIETIFTLMAVIAGIGIYFWLHTAIVTKERIVRIKALLVAIGSGLANIVYSIDATGAISYHYTPIYRLIIFVGIFLMCLGFVMPKWLERVIVGRAHVSEKLLRSFIEEWFAYPVAPTIQTQPHAFSKNLGLDHQQTIGKKILLEFDPASHYEKAIQDFAIEALANVEPIVVFTRRGSAIHSSLGEQKAVKFFCLTQQVSVPKEFSDNEMLLPSSDTSLMIDVFDKTLKAHPQGVVNVVFDSLSDLVLSIGFEKTYRFMRYAVEMLSSPRNTVLFLLNRAAHDPKVASSLKGLFSNQISFGKEGIQAVKLSARAS